MSASISDPGGARWPTREEAAVSRLFSPIRIGAGCDLLSRTWVPAMVPWRATADGFVTSDLTEWYRRFAEGQPGALVVEATGIRDVPSGPLLRIGEDRYVPGLRDLAAVVRSASGSQTRVFIQLIDFLRVRRRPDPVRYFAEFLDLRPAHREALARTTGLAHWQSADHSDVRQRLAQCSPSEQEQILSPRELEDLRMGARERVTDTHLPHIRDLPVILPAAFAAAAVRAKAANFDGVELHYAHAYTMASFLSPTNQRTDGYGGARDARMRLPLEVLAAVRAAVGSDFAVGCRMLGDEAIPGGGTVDDAAVFAVEFARAGFDYLSISRGGKFEDARQPQVGEAAYPYTGPSGAECMPTLRRHGDGARGYHLPLSRRIRTAVRGAGFSTPIVVAGGLQTFADAEEAIERGDADIVGAARQSLADPDWFKKMRDGRGAEIRRCTLTNYCEGLDQKHRKVTCRLWDQLPLSEGEPQLREGNRRLVAPP